MVLLENLDYVPASPTSLNTDASMCRCDNCGPRRPDYVMWMHVPKTGTSFANILIHHSNTSLPGDARVSMCDKNNLMHDKTIDSDRNYSLTHPYLPHQCVGAIDRLHERFPYRSWFPGFFVTEYTDDCDFGAHVPLFDEIWDRHAGHLVGLFRDPWTLTASQYLRIKGWELQTPESRDFTRPTGAAPLIQSAHYNEGSTTAFMLGMSDGFYDYTDWRKIRSRDFSRRAVERLAGFSFIGLTNKWELTVCLYHRMVLRDRPCMPVEFVNNRITLLASSTQAALALQAANWTDRYDQPVFEAAEGIFKANLERFQVNPASCAALRCTELSWHTGAT
jgi:hypothetical protein